jgi:chaperonin GroEL
MSKSKSRRVIFQPAAYQRIQKGIGVIVSAVRPTLGPHPRVVAIDRGIDGKSPELLDNGGVIARRIIALEDRDEDMGAMLIRSLLWRLYDEVGDGTATAAVLFQSVYDQGLRHIIFGGNAMLLRRYLEIGLRAIVAELARQRVPVEGKEQLARLAASLCYDPPLAEMLGEIFDIIGEYGQLEIQTSQGRGLEREYVEGIYWKGGLLSRQMLGQPAKLKVELENPAILITDFEIEDPHDLLPVLEIVVPSGIRSLLVVANKLSDSALSLLLANQAADKFKVIAVKTPGLNSDDQLTALEDLAILTGGRAFFKASGDTLQTIKREDLGQARKVWADQGSYFGVNGGKGNPRTLREHIAKLRAGHRVAEEKALREKLQQRIGKLMGGSATLHIGAATESEMAARKELAKRAADALRGAVVDGVLPGGGVSLLACRPALQRLLEKSTNPDERAAYRILSRALEEPIRTIISNSGGDVSEVMAAIKAAGAGYGFDVTSGQVVNMLQAGIFDAATVQLAVVRSAISSAALSLTIEVLIHKRVRQEVMVPK